MIVECTYRASLLDVGCTCCSLAGAWCASKCSSPGVHVVHCSLGVRVVLCFPSTHVAHSSLGVQGHLGAPLSECARYVQLVKCEYCAPLFECTHCAKVAECMKVLACVAY